METDKSINKSKNISLHKKDQKSQRSIKRNSNKFIKFIKTNLYLNEYNYYFKNAIKMNKLREEKFKEYKLKTEKERKKDILPKMLYFNKFLTNDIKKNSQKKNINIEKNKNNTNTLNISNLDNGSLSSEYRSLAYKKIEKAIIAKNIEEHNKSHFKKTIKAFDDLIKYVDNFQFQKKRPNLKLAITENNENNFIININETTNNSEDEDMLNVENYNYDEFKRKYKNEKLSKNKNSNSQVMLKTLNSQRVLDNNYSENFKNINDKNDNDYNDDHIYITASNYLNKNIIKNNNNNNISKTNYYNEIKEVSNSYDNINKNSAEKKRLFINNMTIISDDSLVKKIKNLGRDFKNGLYFNEYGKYKYTELGLNYPNSVDKFKKIPDYKGNDIEEKKVFKYKSAVTNPKYNYTNIGTFNEKFNNDLSDISTYYGKEYSKGRFIRNPLVSKYSKYIPNYEKYKDLKFIENRYISKNKYKFRLKPLINNKKNNFDKLASIVYKNEHKHDHFQ